MKLLIAYDGSDCAKIAIDDLCRAGLCDDVEAAVLTVADVWPPAPKPASVEISRPPQIGAPRDLTDEAIADARSLAQEGAERVRAHFPSWKVTAESCGDSPARALIQRADAWRPDLFVIGSHGRSALGRLFLGSVALAVVQHAPGSVRIGRRRGDPAADAPGRIIVGVDGSSHAAAAMEAVALRKWPPHTEVRIITVMDLRMFSTPENLLAPAANWVSESRGDILRALQRAGEQAAEKLREAGLHAIPLRREGDPAKSLVQNADDWEADCIFVGAQGLTRMERLLLGSVSSAVAARAHCSVEVVRHGEPEP